MFEQRLIVQQKMSYVKLHWKWHVNEYDYDGKVM